MNECKRQLVNQMKYEKDMYDVAVYVDILLLITEWKQFCLTSWKCIKRLIRENLIIDKLNIYEVKKIEEEYLVYLQIGK